MIERELGQRTYAGHWTAMRDRLGQQMKVALRMDGTMFATRELDVAFSFTTVLQLAACWRPVRVRSLPWRESHEARQYASIRYGNLWNWLPQLVTDVFRGNGV